MYQVDSPWFVTWLAIRTARMTPPISKALKTSGIGCGPRTNEKITSTGATNSATCALGPRRDEDRSARLGSDRDVHGEIHLVLRRHEHRNPVLGRVADDGHHDGADEELPQRDLLGRLGGRVDEDLE